MTWLSKLSTQTANGRSQMPLEGTLLQGQKIADAVINDLTDRKGLRHVWDDIDEQTRDEIRAAWTLLACRVIEAS